MPIVNRKLKEKLTDMRKVGAETIWSDNIDEYMKMLDEHDCVGDKTKKHNALFLNKIDQYNNNKDYRTHYIKLNEKEIMVIDWKHGRSWEYSIASLESANPSSDNARKGGLSL